MTSRRYLRGSSYVDAVAFPLGMLCIPVMRDLAELVTDVKFSELSHNWRHLKGWQRGILGTGIVILATFLILLCAHVIFKYLYKL